MDEHGPIQEPIPYVLENDHFVSSNPYQPLSGNVIVQKFHIYASKTLGHPFASFAKSYYRGFLLKTTFWIMYAPCCTINLCTYVCCMLFYTRTYAFCMLFSSHLLPKIAKNIKLCRFWWSLWAMEGFLTILPLVSLPQTE
jgi:hypothetical protein